MMNKILKLSPIIFVLIIVFYVLNLNSRWKKMMNNNKVIYTIGTTSSLKTTSRSGIYISYSFMTKKGEKLTTDQSFNIKDAKRSYSYIKRKYINKKFFVKYNTQDISYNEIYFDKPVPDSLYNCTKCYWEKPPW
ncbi:hypothetical protein [Tenacibaculum sp. IB213877]|uniref:hypothetical protein n=1 Tax=Tenacibaculum sp. IB213877 TaxID=3097351 RepID=UPI002A5A7CD6|nr:hypothetical protein [Tenacibaculum sp. IB213877]MDY0780890.1 hypothetical protein [Tenacibaculum sp. IB213877]